MALPVNGSTHLIPALLLIYRPRKDDRLSWPSWLTCSGWFTHISGHPSAAGREQDRESSPVRDRRSTTVLRDMVSMRIIVKTEHVIFEHAIATDIQTHQSLYFAPIQGVKFAEIKSI